MPTDTIELALLLTLAALALVVLPWRRAEQARVATAWMALGAWLAEPLAFRRARRAAAPRGALASER